MARSPSPLPFQLAICLLALPLFSHAEGHDPSHNTASKDWTHRSPHQEGWKKQLAQKNDQKLGHEKVHPLPLIWPVKSKKIHHETPNDIMAYDYPQHDRYHNPYLAKPQEVEDQVLDSEEGAKPVVYRSAGVTKSSASRDDNVDEIIHSVVLQGTFGEDMTMKTNKTTEYLIEYLYNATSLKDKYLHWISSSRCHKYFTNLRHKCAPNMLH
ncbi:uncharacterized protein LOC134778588 [Penaeus indicus]|uniref:uncharacterized protein LOC134778588 n=1 Tax=Penaeus indicus TaxID=29960 RepID=UPI00300DA6A4